jgi:SAM-dependent methyltransferase
MRQRSEYGALAPFYDIFINWEKRLSLEIPFILGQFPENRTGLKCLDIGCGTGRHLEHLQNEGFKTEGCEPSPELRRQARSNLPGVEIYPYPMERLGQLAGEHGPWDLVICLGNTLAHLKPDLRPDFFKALADSLSEGGVAVLHLLGYDRIVRLRPDSLPEKTVEHEGRRITFKREYSYMGEEIGFTLRIIIDGTLETEQYETLYPFASEEFITLSRTAGLSRTEMFAGFNGDKTYTQDSDNLVCVISR